jgi:hypothetical protein
MDTGSGSSSAGGLGDEGNILDVSFIPKCMTTVAQSEHIILQESIDCSLLRAAASNPW